MSRNLCSLILGPICALLFFSCSHSTPKVSVTSANEMAAPPNTTESYVLFHTTAATPVVDAVKPPHLAEDLLKKMAPPVQKFSFPSNEEALILCENGSVIKFEPEVFVYAGSQEPVTGNIDLQVTEYINTADMIFGGLETRCGNEIIETGGMLYIAATSDGKDCEIADGEFYSVEMPAENNKDGMQYFYTENNSNGTNWTPRNRGALVEYQTYNTYVCGMSLVEKERREKRHTMNAEFPGGLKGMYQFLHDNYKVPAGFENTTLHATSYINFTLSDSGKVLKVYTPKQITTYADKEILAAFKKMPRWNVDFNPGAKKKLMIPVKMDLVRDPSQIKLKEEMMFLPDVVRYNAAYVADRYLMNVSQVGWINCDRFVAPEQPRVSFFVEADSTSDVTMRIVFHSIRSVIGGARYTKGFEFTNMPQGEMVTIVALRMNKNGTAELATKTCAVSDATIHDLHYFPADEAEIRKRFELLGKNADPLTAML